MLSSAQLETILLCHKPSSLCKFPIEMNNAAPNFDYDKRNNRVKEKYQWVPCEIKRMKNENENGS